MDYISTKEASKILNVSPQWIANLCKAGLLEAKKPGGREWWISKQSILEYKARNIKRGPKKKSPVA
jgi:excisionase family DNA binding protein